MGGLIALPITTSSTAAQDPIECDKAGSEECKEEQDSNTRVRDYRDSDTGGCPEGQRLVRVRKTVDGERVTAFECREPSRRRVRDNQCPEGQKRVRIRDNRNGETSYRTVCKEDDPVKSRRDDPTEESEPTPLRDDEPILSGGADFVSTCKCLCGPRRDPLNPGGDYDWDVEITVDPPGGDINSCGDLDGIENCRGKDTVTHSCKKGLRPKQTDSGYSDRDVELPSDRLEENIPQQ